jgi:XTP/dITP diphosphohydrolase
MGQPVFPQMEPASGNIKKLLLKMKGIHNREARFRTVISLVLEGREHLFEGIIEGKITLQPSGNKGFGYDPVFRPDGYEETFAEMDLLKKNNISHRARAMNSLIEFLKAK